MRKLIFSLFMMIFAVLAINAQGKEKLGRILLQNDTLAITESDQIYRVSVYVTPSSTDSCEVAGDIFNVGSLTTDTITIAPGESDVVGCLTGVINKHVVISRSGCTAKVTLFRRQRY